MGVLGFAIEVGTVDIARYRQDPVGKRYNLIKVQTATCLGATDAVYTAPTAALEAMLGLSFSLFATASAVQLSKTG